MVALDSTSRSLINLHVACLVITTIAVASRFVAKVRTGARLSWDDGFMVIAWATLVAFIAMVFKLIYLGSAQVLTVPLPPEDYVKLYQIAYAAGVVFETANIATKISILFFYCRIFTTTFFKKQAIIVGTLCICWYIASVLVTLLQCIPAHKVWNKTAPGKCLDLATFVLGYEITNAFLDVALIVMAVMMIHTLQLKRGQKILISSIFMLGGFVCIASILRIVYLYHPNDPADMIVQGPIWSTVSVAAAVLCGNLPLLKPLLTKSIVPKSVRSWYSSWPRSGAYGSKHPYDSKGIKLDVVGPYNQLGGSKQKAIVTSSKMKGQTKDPYPLISVNTTIDVE